MSLKSKWSLKSIESRSSITISVALLLLLLAVVDRELIGCAVANVLGARVGEVDEEVEVFVVGGVVIVGVVVVVGVAVGDWNACNPFNAWCSIGRCSSSCCGCCVCVCVCCVSPDASISSDLALRCD
jgi:hypothetical protein